MFVRYRRVERERGPSWDILYTDFSSVLFPARREIKLFKNLQMIQENPLNVPNVTLEIIPRIIYKKIDF